MPTSEELYKQLQEVPAFNREQAYADWQSGKKPFLDAVMSNYERPKPTLTPEQEKKARFGSALTDSFTSLAQLWGHGQGARIQPMAGKTNQQTTNERLETFRKKYEDDLARYDDKKTNAGMMDFQDYARQAQETRGEKRQYLLLDAQRAQRSEEQIKERTQQLEDQEKKRTNAKEDAIWEFENIVKPKFAEQDKYDAKQVARRKSYSGGGGSYTGGRGLPKGYIGLQNSSGKYLQMHKDAWQTTAQELYGEMTRKGLIPKLTVPGKDAMGMSIQKEVKAPNQIAAYMAQQAYAIPDELIDRLNARSRGEAYQAPTQQKPAAQQQQTKKSWLNYGKTKANNDPLGLYH